MKILFYLLIIGLIIIFLPVILPIVSGIGTIVLGFFGIYFIVNLLLGAVSLIKLFIYLCIYMLILAVGYGISEWHGFFVALIIVIIIDSHKFIKEKFEYFKYKIIK